MFYSHGITPEQVLYALPTMDITGTALNAICPVNVIAECPPGKYRTYSGHCNNVNKPFWGAIYEPLQRILRPDYSDGLF